MSALISTQVEKLKKANHNTEIILFSTYITRKCYTMRKLQQQGDLTYLGIRKQKGEHYVQRIDITLQVTSIPQKKLHRTKN